MPITKHCQFCKVDLVWYGRAGCWVCPVVEDTTLVGLIAPTETVYVRFGVGKSEEQARHTTCLPGELFDEDFEVTPAIEYARTSKLPSPQAVPTRDAQGHRNIVDDRGIPIPNAGPGSKEALNMFQCNGCGVRSSSATHISGHLARSGHEYAENARGHRIHRPFRGAPPASEGVPF